MDSQPLNVRGFSFFHLIQNADPVIQNVMIALAAASIFCWTIGLEKLIRYALFLRQLRALERALKAKEDKSALISGLAARFRAIAALEPGHKSLADFQAGLAQSLQAEILTELRPLQSGLPFLATVGSTAPFVGLFGTVWGIMNSFVGIASAKDTSLAVVAPGIAEALLATAIGLAAAIPAVIIYNLANVFLSNSSERLGVAAFRFAKAFAAENVSERDASVFDRLSSAAAE
jgi:biopolymer transport protein ExbB/TolQ